MTDFNKNNTKKQNPCIFEVFYDIPSYLDIISLFKWLRAMLLCTEEKYFHSFLFSEPEFFIFLSLSVTTPKISKKLKIRQNCHFWPAFFFQKSIFLVEHMECSCKLFGRPEVPQILPKNKFGAIRKIFEVKKMRFWTPPPKKKKKGPFLGGSFWNLPNSTS